VHSHDFTECSGPRGHQNLSDSVVEVLLTLFRYSEICLGSPLLSRAVDKLPNTILDRELFTIFGSTSREDSDFKPTHREQKLGVLSTVDGTEGIIPFDSGEGSRKRAMESVKRFGHNL
jgi:hypothetical protein